MIIGIDEHELAVERTLEYVGTFRRMYRCERCSGDTTTHWFQCDDREVHMVLCDDCAHRDVVMWAPRLEARVYDDLPPDLDRAIDDHMNDDGDTTRDDPECDRLFPWHHYEEAAS